MPVVHNGTMKSAERRHLGLSVVGLLACALFNVYVFRFGVLYGLVGLNLTKHVGVAVLCQAIGVHKGKLLVPRRRTCRHSAHPHPIGPHPSIRERR